MVQMPLKDTLHSTVRYVRLGGGGGEEGGGGTDGRRKREE